ncbi:hypothetical protein H0H81_006670 [Sphagnurus paluster]|uniref:SET domain-containing protein n=1 Tax=Sphagnurus paluster TaxID=117069 RepID=A0A9P7KJG2_9AGAR|nr:hypothetical protein H0H81_006670 [Sphagnurus paluster]
MKRGFLAKQKRKPVNAQIPIEEQLAKLVLSNTVEPMNKSASSEKIIDPHKSKSTAQSSAFSNLSGCLLYVNFRAKEPLPVKLPIGDVDKSLPENYKTGKPLWTEVPAETTDTREGICATTVPPQRNGETLADNPDNWSECIFLSRRLKYKIISTPGFPAPVPRPPNVRHRLGPSAFGTGMFATCDIKMGELVMSERPLLVTSGGIPSLYTPPPGDPKPTAAQIIQATIQEYERLLEYSVSRMLPENRAAFFKLHNAHTKDGSGPILGRIRTNAIGITIDTYEQKDLGSVRYGAVFNEISYINHSCVPNVSPKFSALSFSSRVRAIRDIKQGEEILISYCKPEVSTAERQAELKPYDFQCTCHSCSDPSSDAVLWKILTSPLAVERLDCKHRLMCAESWIAEIERKGWYHLEVYGTHLSIAAMCAKVLKKFDVYHKYENIYEAWTEGMYGESRRIL